MSRTEKTRKIVGSAERVQVIEIEIAPARAGSRRLYQKNGQLWDVYFAGSHLLRSLDPEHDAARALLARGLRGTMHVYHRGSDVWSLKMDIERAAARKVSETGSEGPIFRPYRDWQRPERALPAAKKGTGQ